MITAVIFFLDITVFPIDNTTSESSTFNLIGIPVLAVLFYLHYYRKVGCNQPYAHQRYYRRFSVLKISDFKQGG